MVKVNAPRIKGRGDYSITPFIAGAANLLAPGSGPAVSKLMSAAGNGLSHVRSMIKKIRGSGDYTIGDQPTNYNVVMNTDQIPKFTQGSRGFTVSHREYVGQVVAPTTAGSFALTEYKLNPLARKTMPWACKIGAMYNKYKFHGCVFEFKSNSGNISGSTNTALGNVALAFTPNPCEPPPTTKIDLELYEGVVSVKPSESCLCAVECDPKTRQFNTMQVSPDFELFNSVHTMQQSERRDLDPFLTDWGNLWVGVSGVQGSQVQLGELWVSYCIEFYEQRQDYNACQRALWQTSTGMTTTSLGTLIDKSKHGDIEVVPGVPGYFRIRFGPSCAGAAYHVTARIMQDTSSPSMSGPAHTNCEVAFFTATDGAFIYGTGNDGVSFWIVGEAGVSLLNADGLNSSYLDFPYGAITSNVRFNVKVSEANTAMYRAFPS